MKLRHVFLILCLTSLIQAEPKAPLAPEERTNGARTLAAVGSISRHLKTSVALILGEKDHPLATATWVGADGYFLAKASDTPLLEYSKIRYGDNQTAAIREIHRNVALDLVLAQAVGVTGVKHIGFDSKPQTTAYGQWLTSPAKAGQEIKIGVVSAQRRQIPGEGAAIGVRMDEKPIRGGGVRVVGIAEDSPAAVAGLRKDDVLLELAGEKLSQFQRVHEIIRQRHPGELLELKCRRGVVNLTLQVRLASRSKILQNWEGEDFANGGISIRTDNFPQVIQHEIPLSPLDMGSPLLDLAGNPLGINIARVDRVTTFALPAEIFWKEIQPLIEADRHPPKALKP